LRAPAVTPTEPKQTILEMSLTGTESSSWSSWITCTRPFLTWMRLPCFAT
jgi:hypothetical protein